jgi:hypothetical protein
MASLLARRLVSGLGLRAYCTPRQACRLRVCLPPAFEILEFFWEDDPVGSAALLEEPGRGALVELG